METIVKYVETVETVFRLKKIKVFYFFTIDEVVSTVSTYFTMVSTTVSTVSTSVAVKPLRSSPYSLQINGNAYRRNCMFLGYTYRTTCSLGIKKRVAQNVHMDQKVFFNEFYFDWLRAFASGYRIGVGVVLNTTRNCSRKLMLEILPKICPKVLSNCPKLAQKVPKMCAPKVPKK